MGLQLLLLCLSFELYFQYDLKRARDNPNINEFEYKKYEMHTNFHLMFHFVYLFDLLSWTI